MEQSSVSEKTIQLRLRGIVWRRQKGAGDRFRSGCDMPESSLAAEIALGLPRAERAAQGRGCSAKNRHGFSGFRSNTQAEQGQYNDSIFNYLQNPHDFLPWETGCADFRVYSPAAPRGIAPKNGVTTPGRGGSEKAQSRKEKERARRPSLWHGRVKGRERAPRTKGAIP